VSRDEHRPCCVAVSVNDPLSFPRLSAPLVQFFWQARLRHGVALVAEAPERLVDRDMLPGANCEIWRLRGLVTDREAQIAALKLELRAAADDDEAFEDVLRERDTLRQDLSRLAAKKVVADELLTDFRTADEDAVILKADLRSAQAAKEETAQLLSPWRKRSCGWMDTS
jgi:hypothetical protein